MKALFFVVVGLSILIPYQASTIYVKEGATGTGASWADAYGLLQDALNDTESGDQIWVAAGTYKPTSDYGLDIGDRGKHFRMKNGVAIYGGFNGSETALDQRDITNNETILTGDLLDNDNPASPVEDLYDDPSRDDNCYHVFYHPNGTDLDTTAILDGFTITGGNANCSYPWQHHIGGGMYNEGGTCPTVSNCRFNGNSAGTAGGICNRVDSNPTVSGCIFSSNSAIFSGGGMSNSHSNPTVTDCAFSNNLAEKGGGMTNSDSSPMVTNCIFTGNTANDGGGMSNWESVPVVIGCTFSNNLAENGGGMYNGWDNRPILHNCILWSNTADSGNEIYNGSQHRPMISYCDIADSLSGGAWDVSLGLDLGGNIDVDPMFVRNPDDGGDGWGDDPVTPAVDEGANDDYGDLHLQSGSLCIDAGDSNVVTVATDLGGNPRVMGAAVDMGAYEFVPNTAPVADAGDDIVVYAGYEGTAVVKLDGSGSFDADRDVLEYFWSLNGVQIATGVDPNVVFAAGVHVIELVVDDGELSSEPNSVVVTVIEAVEAVAYVFPRVLNTTAQYGLKKFGCLCR